MCYKLSAFADEVSNDFAKQIKFLKDRNIPYLEIRNLDGKNVGDLTLAEAKEVRRRLDAEGLAVWSVGSRLGKISVTDDFATHLDEFMRTLDIADSLECNKIRMFSFYVPAGEDPDLYRDTVMERLDRFLERTRGRGIQLCHENEKGIYGDTFERCLDIAHTFADMRLVFDPANFVQCGVDTVSAWNALKEYVTYVHIKDAFYDGTVVPAGKGDGNIKAIISDYKQRGGGVLTLEPHLSVFDGLAALEREGEQTKIGYSYPDGESAFIAAHEALTEIIDKI